MTEYGLTSAPVVIGKDALMSDRQQCQDIACHLEGHKRCREEGDDE